MFKLRLTYTEWIIFALVIASILAAITTSKIHSFRLQKAVKEAVFNKSLQ